MAIAFTPVRKAPAAAQLHGIPVCSDQIDEKPGPFDWAVLASRGFTGKAGQVQIVASEGKQVIAAVGMGPSDKVDAAVVRQSSAALARAARRHKHVASSLLSVVPDSVPAVEAAQALAEGTVLGAHQNGLYKSDRDANKLAKVSAVGSTAAAVKNGLSRGEMIGEAVCVARDFVNEPGGTLTPVVFAQRAAKLAKREKLTVSVMNLAQIKKAKLGGVLGVNRGSTIEPRFVKISYKPKGKATGSLALVGKGITFDAGGLSIKSGAGMMTMKCDMGGAATVLGTMSVIGRLDPKCAVTAYVPMTDNMLGGDATRPGDILKIRNGKTVEVLNTDAEGRLILADALSLASEDKHDAIVDLATLTGAVVVALGSKFTGLMSNSQEWADQVSDAADAVDEQVWQLPLPNAYRRQLDSSIADLKNIGGREAGSITAGLFLQEFVADEIPWVHLDVAGTAWTDSGDGMTPKGGTGWGVRTLCSLIENFTPPPAND